MGEVVQLPVCPETCLILGQRAKADSPLWTGLNLRAAEVRRWEGYDVHLGVPWCHPDDQTGSPDDFDCVYRLEARMSVGKRWKNKVVKAVDFKKRGGEWLLLVTH